MNNYEISDIIQHFLAIKRDFYRRLKHPKLASDKDFDLYCFPQLWGSTALGFPGCGGAAMTTALTYVFAPKVTVCDEDCVVYYDGEFAYTAPFCKELMEDIRNQSIASVMKKGKYKRSES